MRDVGTDIPGKHLPHLTSPSNSSTSKMETHVPNISKPNPTLGLKTLEYPSFGERTSPRNFGPPRQLPAICGGRSLDEGCWARLEPPNRSENEFYYNPMFVGIHFSRL